MPEPGDPRGQQRPKEAKFDPADQEFKALLGLVARAKELHSEVITKGRILHAYIAELAFKPIEMQSKDTKLTELRAAFDTAYREWQRQHLATLYQFNGISQRPLSALPPDIERMRKQEIAESDMLHEFSRHVRKATMRTWERERAMREGQDARRKADPKEQARMQKLLNAYQEKRRIRAKALEESEQVFTSFKEAFADLPDPAPYGEPAPNAEELTAEERATQDKVHELQRELGRLFWVGLHGKEGGYEGIEKDREAGRLAAKYTLAGMPQSWINKDGKERAKERAGDLDNLVTDLLAQNKADSELRRDGYLTFEEWERDFKEDAKIHKRMSEIHDEAHELYMQNIRRVIRKDSDNETHRLRHDSDGPPNNEKI